MIQNSFFLKILVKGEVAGLCLPIYSSNNRTLDNGLGRGLRPSPYLHLGGRTSSLRHTKFSSSAPFDQEKNNKNLGFGEGFAPSHINQQSLFSHQKSKLPNIGSQKSDLSCVFSYVQSSDTRLMNRFLNFLTKKGKKSTAESIFSKTLYLFIKKANEGTMTSPSTGFAGQGPAGTSLQALEALSIFTILDQAISNVKPFFEVKKVRVAGTTYQVPSLMKSKRQEGIAMNWILQSASERKKKNPSQKFENCLAFEIFEAFQKQGQARMKRNELHKLAEANRAFSHFRWW